MSRDGRVVGEHLWKRFRADRQRGTIGETLAAARSRLTRRGGPRWRWALRDISLDVAPGDSLGLIGTNGSGKSTLLKLLAGVMDPYAGRLDVVGRVGALIEVRAGIHPDLTGRENVYLYGSLLGLRRREVAARFDDIVDFAELSDAIDRQVKYYSSGMQMRLGFAVAAFMDPDVLLVDEVLAVGDSSFQQRCLDRMRTVLEQGTTLVFVSHDLAAVESICASAMWLDNGTVAAMGPARGVLDQYRSRIEAMAEVHADDAGPVRLRKVALDRDLPASGQDLTVTIDLTSEVSDTGAICLGVSEGTPMPIFVVQRPLVLPRGDLSISCSFQSLPLPAGTYYVWLGVMALHGDFFKWQPVRQFTVSGPTLDVAPRGVVRLSPVYVDAAWSVSAD